MSGAIHIDLYVINFGCGHLCDYFGLLILILLNFSGRKDIEFAVLRTKSCANEIYFSIFAVVEYNLRNYYSMTVGGGIKTIVCLNCT